MKKPVKINSDLTIEYQSIPPLAIPAINQNYEKNNPKPEKPQYKVEAAGGVVLWMDHDETTVETDEEKELLNKYLKDNFEWQKGLTEKITLLFLLEGIEIRASKKLKKQWHNRLERYYDLTDLEEDDLHLLYLQTFIFKTSQEIEAATKTIMSLTGVSEADLEAAEKLF